MKIFLITIIICNFINIAYLQGDFHFYENVNKYYKFFRNPKTWNQAVDLCKQENSTLAMPRNPAEVEVLLNIFSAYPPSLLRGITHPDYILLGFHDIFQEGEYLSLNGVSIQYYFHTWGGGQPDNANNEDCGSLHRTGRINDYPCQVQAVFICERSSDKQNDIISECDTTDLAYKKHHKLDQCYKLHLNPRTWATARAICEAEGGHLAIVQSKAVEDFLVSMFNDPNNKVDHVVHKAYALLGFHDMYNENHYVTVLDKNLHDTPYVHWASGQPDNAGGNENCGSMHSSGGINDFPCSVPAVFFCQKVSFNYKLDIRFSVE